ncbi:hypothetical protein EMCRGX_G030881 [Ephydatia muelleri]
MNYLCLIVAFLGVVTADEVVSTNDAVRVGTLQFQQMIQNTNWCSCPPCAFGCCPVIVPPSNPNGSLIRPVPGLRGDVALIVDWGTCTAQPAGGFKWYISWGDGKSDTGFLTTLGPIQQDHSYAIPGYYGVYVSYCSNPPAGTNPCCDSLYDAISPSKPVSNPDLPSEYNLQGSEGACEIRAIVKASSSTNHGLMTYSTCMHKTHQRPGSPISRNGVHSVTQREQSAERKGREGPAAHVAKKEHEHGSVLLQFVERKDQPGQLTVGAKVVQAGKDFTYVLVILGGFVVTGFLFWTVGSEFFSSSSTSSIFSAALKKVKADPRVRDLLGEPIVGYGEESGRGRRRDILNQKYVVENKEYMRIKFYVKGSRRKANVQLDLMKNDKGKYDCRFLFVELEGPPHSTLVITDNR